MEQAKRLGLHTSEPTDFTIRRLERRGKFIYLDEDGDQITSTRTLKRIESVKIRPDLHDTRISEDSQSHIQAIGSDERGRTQYVYHPLWAEVRKTVKFESTLPAFGEALPKIREAVTRDLRSPDLSKKRLLAAIVRLLDDTLIRVGNATYAKSNRSFGLTTLRKSHVELDGNKILFLFPGKSGVVHDIEYTSAPLAKLIRELRSVPGWSLFKYANDDGEFETVTADSVNDYLKEITEGDFTAKDFRTWGGTVAAAEYLHSIPYPGSESEMKNALTDSAKAASEVLENTPAISRASYIHPKIFEIYQSDPALFAAAFRTASRRLERQETGRTVSEEAAFLILRDN